MAIDIHELFQGDRSLLVKRDFARGLQGPRARPQLNRIACRLKQVGLFRELLTPDSDQWHHDHIHLGLAPLGSWTPEAQPSRIARPTLPPAVVSEPSAAGAAAATGPSPVVAQLVPTRDSEPREIPEDEPDKSDRTSEPEGDRPQPAPPPPDPAPPPEGSDPPAEPSR